MIRAKWLTAEPKISLRALAGRMRSQAFTNESQDGFLLDRTREDHIVGRYIEKLTYHETVPDPFGQELTFERITYRQVQFILYREFPQLELRDAPRGTAAFMSKLVQLCDFDLTSAPFSVDVMRWAEAIAQSVGSAAAMDMMQLSEITIAPNVTGTMVLKSDRDVRDSLKSVIGSRAYTVEKVRLKWNDSTRAIVVQLSNTGSAKVDSTDSDLLPDLRKALHGRPRADQRTVRPLTVRGYHYRLARLTLGFCAQALRFARYTWALAKTANCRVLAIRKLTGSAIHRRIDRVNGTARVTPADIEPIMEVCLVEIALSVLKQAVKAESHDQDPEN